MDTLRLVPNIGIRDISVSFEVAGRTISTHVESDRPLPVLVSLKSLTASLREEVGPPLFVCGCGRSTCDDARSVNTELTGENLIWRIALPQGDHVYELHRSQVSAELGRVVGIIGSKTEQAHGAKYRFRPSVDAELFNFRSPRSAGLQTGLSNAVYFSVIVTAVALAVGLLRTV